MAKQKACKECKKSRPVSEFPKSATAKDGRLGYCVDCWSARMSKIRTRGGNGSVGEEPAKKPRKANGNGLDLFNEALDAVNGSREVWQVVADDGDQREFRGKSARRRAYKQALLWKLDGYDCTLREIHEYKPTLKLEVV